MDNKGFTLVELIVTIGIIIILGLLIVPKTLSIINESREKGYKEIENRLIDAAGKYIVEEYIDNDTTSIIITKDQLIEKNYIGEIYDLNDNSICDASVEVRNLDKTATFTAHLSCANYTS